MGFDTNFMDETRNYGERLKRPGTYLMQVDRVEADEDKLALHVFLRDVVSGQEFRYRIATEMDRKTPKETNNAGKPTTWHLEQALKLFKACEKPSADYWKMKNRPPLDLNYKALVGSEMLVRIDYQKNSTEWLEVKSMVSTNKVSPDMIRNLGPDVFSTNGGPDQKVGAEGWEDTVGKTMESDEWGVASPQSNGGGDLRSDQVPF